MCRSTQHVTVTNLSIHISICICMYTGTGSPRMDICMSYCIFEKLGGNLSSGISRQLCSGQNCFSDMPDASYLSALLHDWHPTLDPLVKKTDAGCLHSYLGCVNQQTTQATITQTLREAALADPLIAPSCLELCTTRRCCPCEMYPIHCPPSPAAIFSNCSWQAHTMQNQAAMCGSLLSCSPCHLVPALAIHASIWTSSAGVGWIAKLSRGVRLGGVFLYVSKVWLMCMIFGKYNHTIIIILHLYMSFITKASSTLQPSAIQTSSAFFPRFMACIGVALIKLRSPCWLVFSQDGPLQAMNP